MIQINPHLHLNGTTREAMAFYKDVFGGEVKIMTVGEMPADAKTGMPGGVTKENENNVMHAELEKDGETIIMAADMMDPKTFTPGDTITLSINCTSEDEIKTIFSKLSAGGKVTMPLKDEFWGATFGMLTDKFGIDWMLNFQKKPMKK